MLKRVVAVVGRPNVGKSTFFNKMAGRRISIVDDTPGVTRDRIYADVTWTNHEFTLVDTGGIETSTDDVILSKMRYQAELAIEASDLILFMVDAKSEISTQDREIAEMLRKSGKKIILLANKVDNIEYPDSFYNYYELGFEDVFPISSANMINFGDLLDKIVEELDISQKIMEDEEDDRIKVAVIGKPNVGKSSLINSLLGTERLIVSDIAGTTREAIDTDFEFAGDKFILIDTAGIRRKSKIDERLEYFSVIRTKESIERADVCVIMIDAEEGVTEQDKKIAGLAHEAGKASILVANKWDLIEKDSKTYKKFEKDIRNDISFMQYAPIEFISAINSQRLEKLLEIIKFVNNQAALRVKTGLLNDIVSDALLMHQAPSDKGKRLKIFYIAQVDVKPPRFSVFVNDKELAHFSYMRYIENTIRNNFNFVGTPIVMELKQRRA